MSTAATEKAPKAKRPASGPSAKPARRKPKAKKDVAAYAASIGLDLGDYENKKLKELQDEVINFQEEQIAESADGDGSGEDDGE